MEDPPEFLHHYTSQASFLGIIESRVIWATDILYLNDTAEFTYAVQLASEILNDYRADEQEVLKAGFTILSKGLPWTSNYSIYVVSFSEQDDLLSQWRAYSPAGGGFSIAVHRSTMQRTGAASGFRLVRGEYDQGVQKDTIRQVFQETLQIPEQEAAARFCSERFLHLAPTLKHPAFAKEREWRLVSPPISIEDPRVKYRPGKSMLVPYIRGYLGLSFPGL